MTAPPRPAPLWQVIRDALREEIAGGAFGPGARLPTEAVLSARFGVNRHTVRRALAALAEAGQVRARRGAGVFVTQAPTDYPVGARVRFHQNLAAAGKVPGKRVLALATRTATPPEAEALALPPGAAVHVYDGLSFADAVPIALFRSVFPALRFAGLCDDLAALASVTAALKRHGVDDYTRRATRLTAVTADRIQAAHLDLAEGAALILSSGINVDPDGNPVEYGQTWFAGARVTLTLGA